MVPQEHGSFRYLVPTHAASCDRQPDCALMRDCQPAMLALEPDIPTLFGVGMSESLIKVPQGGQKIIPGQAFPDNPIIPFI